MLLVGTYVIQQGLDIFNVWECLAYSPSSNGNFMQLSAVILMKTAYKYL